MFFTQFCHNSYAVFNNIGQETVKIAVNGGKVVVKILADKLSVLEAHASAKVKESAIILAESAKNVGIDSAVKIAESIKKVTYVAWAGVGTAATYVGYHITTGVKDRLNKRRQERDLYAAKKLLLESIVKNAGEKEGLFGLPEGCEKTVCTLLSLPNGENELKKIIDILKNNGKSSKR